MWHRGVRPLPSTKKGVCDPLVISPELCETLVIRLLFLKLDLAPISFYVAGKTLFAKVRSLDPVEPAHEAYQRDGQENAFHSELNASQTFLKVGSPEKLFFCVNVPLLAVPGRCRSLQQASTGSFLCGAPVKGDGGHVWQAFAKVTRLATQASARHLHREGHIRFRFNHCQSVAKRLLDHMMCRKAQVVHHSLPSRNAVPPAPVSSSSRRHGLLAAKIAKHEHLQSIKTRICPLSPEQGAPSFSRKPMMSIDVGVRVRQGNYSELRQMCAAESTFIIPVEELLRQHGTPLALLACIEGTLFAAADGLSNLVLVGHSFCISVAHQLSTHLERQGVRVFGIVVALDLRHGSTSVPPVPTSLADFAMARSHFRLTVSTLDLSTPLVPHGQLHARDFASAAERSHVSAVVNEMDHLDVANTGSWDIATRLHRSGKSRKEAGNSRHRMMLILGEPLQFETLSAHRTEDLQHIARTIQGSMNCASRDESPHIWLARRLLQVVFDHRHYNGQQLVELLQKNRDRLCSIEGPYVVNEFVLVRPSVPQPTQAPGSLQDLLNISIMEGPKLRMPMREIYHEISKIFQADFVMYVDISHLLAEETCFLRFTVRWNQDFHQQWQQVERLSSDLGEVLRCWRQHQEGGERWATVVPTRGGFPFFYGNMEQEEPARGDIYGIVFNPNGANCFCSFLHHKEIHDPYQSERVHKFASKLQLQHYNCVTSRLWK